MNRSRTFVIGAMILATAACGGDDTPDSIALVDEPVVNAPSTTAVSVAEPAPTSSTTTAPAVSTTAPQITAPSTTVVVAPPTPPMQPVVVIECASNPPHTTVSFGEPAGAALEWEVITVEHPGGTGMEPVTTAVASDTVAPGQSVAHDLGPQVLEVRAVAETAAGAVETTVGVQRYTGCPTSTSTSPRIVDPINCMTGRFTFVPADGSGIAVDSVDVVRVDGPDETLPVHPAGAYTIPRWDGPEELKVVVTFTDADGTHEEHLNQSCWQLLNGAPYDLCVDEIVRIAYPTDWWSNLEGAGLEGAASCETFGPDDGNDASVTLTRHAGVSIDDAVAAVAQPGTWQLIDSFSSTSSSTVTARQIWEVQSGQTGEALSRTYFLQVGADTWMVAGEGPGLSIVDGMANSITWTIQ